MSETDNCDNAIQRNSINSVLFFFFRSVKIIKATKYEYHK